jgi:tetratricopeptide (TPR) repeat protein
MPHIVWDGTLSLVFIGSCGMKQLRIALLTFICVLCGAADSPVLLAQHGSVTVDWKAELAKAKAGIEKNPKSAFWHDQAGVAYNALGDVENAVKELKLASTLDPANPHGHYALYAVYKRRGIYLEKQREVLLDALEKDPQNPWGHFEFAHILEAERYWPDSLREYQTAKRLAASVNGPVYLDPRGNPYNVDGVRGEVDEAIERLAKLNDSTQHQR